MSNKDYQAIAHILKNVKLSLPTEEEVERVQDALIDYFAQDNPKFDVDKFNKACGN